MGLLGRLRQAAKEAAASATRPPVHSEGSSARLVRVRDEVRLPRVRGPVDLGLRRTAETFNLHWQDGVAVSLGGREVGWITSSDAAIAVEHFDRVGRTLTVTAQPEKISGETCLRAALPFLSEIAPWMHVAGESLPSRLALAPSVGLGKYDLEHDAAAGLLLRKERAQWAAAFTVEPVTRGKNVGQNRVIVWVRGRQLGRIAPSRRAGHPAIFEAAERAAGGTLVLWHRDDGIGARVSVLPGRDSR